MSLMACNYPNCDGGYATGYCHSDCRVVCCAACDGEGRAYERHQWFCRHTGYHDDDVDTGPCPQCEGTGGEIIQTEPIEMEDLDR